MKYESDWTKWRGFFIKFCYDLRPRPRNVIQSPCIPFTHRHSVGEVSARFGQGKRGYASDMRSQTDEKTERQMDKQTDKWTGRSTTIGYPQSGSLLTKFTLYCNKLLYRYGLSVNYFCGGNLI